jgi:D-alanine--poly(phosphoribitol) ligase subunit 1
MQQNVLEYLEYTSKKFPEKIAIEDEHGTVTFKQLKQNAQYISKNLLDLGITPNNPIAVYLPKSIQAIEVFLGVLYTGCFYVPLDVNNPVNRLNAIIENINPIIIVTADEFKDKIYNSVLNDNKILLISNEEKPDFVENIDHYNQILDTDPMYILNTSGSTGIPKGVTLSHKSMIDYIDWVIETYNFNETLIIGNQSPLHFDISASDLYLTLATGSKLVLIPERFFMFPSILLDFLIEKEVNFLYWVPSIISNISKLDLLSKKQIQVKTLFYGGELMPTKHLMYWKRKLPDTVFSNFFGPTEVTVICSHYILDRDFADNEPLPIGFPCKNTNILILNEEDKLVTVPNQQGELCVRGNSLALGYYNAPEKTAAAFVQNPLNPYYPERIYRTGDIAYYNEQGELMYKGRKDFQIKHMGYRIELGEIETAVLAIDSIGNACVLYEYDSKNIILIYESTSELSHKDIVLKLTTIIPKYMLPTKSIQLNSMPLNVNGKIDRVALQKQYIQSLC